MHANKQQLTFHAFITAGGSCSILVIGQAQETTHLVGYLSCEVVEASEEELLQGPRGTCCGAVNLSWAL